MNVARHSFSAIVAQSPARQRITSNLPFDEWTETFGSERLTGALLDRLTHHVNILEMNGESYRLGQSKARQDKA
jgi:DNA replication protein DnaC